MKEVRLIEIELSEWKGQTRVVRFDGRVCKVSGRNGCGKTTLYMAYMWLLTGYTDSLNVRNHELYDCLRDIDENTPMASVRGVFSIDGGQVELYRGARPRFIRNKMDGTYRRMSSDEYVYKVNGVSLSGKEYNDYVASAFGPLSLLPYALNGERLASLMIRSKSAAMDVLMEISGRSMVIPSAAEESAIKGDIKKYGESIIGKNTVIYELGDMMSRYHGGDDAEGCDDDKVSVLCAALEGIILDAESRLHEKLDIMEQRAALNRELADIEDELAHNESMPDESRTYLNSRVTSIVSEDSRLSLDLSGIQIDELSERMRPILNELCDVVGKKKESEITSALCERVEALRQELRDMSAKWAKKKGELEQMRNAHYEACKSVIGIVNERLSECRVVLTSLQKSGDAKADCVLVTTDGVPYATANNSQRARMCVDIQRLLMQRIGSILPIFIDEANKFCKDNIPDYDGQKVLIYVSESPSVDVKTDVPW